MSINEKLNEVQNHETTPSRKRKAVVDISPKDIKGMRKSSKRENEKEEMKNKTSSSRKRKADADQRSFLNPDGETCWLNTVLQMVLTALDSEISLQPKGSQLWQLLVALQKADTSVSLNPMDVKKLLLQTDIERIKLNNLPKSFSCFGLPNNSLLLSSEKIGQQDCIDFFRCLNTNKESWPDVSNLFSISTVTETKCDGCKSITQQAVITGELYMTIYFSPLFNMSMKNHVQTHFNTFNEEIEGRRDEDGCGKTCKAWRRTRLADIKQTNHIIFFVDRRKHDESVICTTEFYVEKDSIIELTDVKGNSGKFIPLAILHHEGFILEDGETVGHYRADVKNIRSGQWFRTSDNEKPECLDSKDLSNQGSVFLYKRIQ